MRPLFASLMMFALTIVTPASVVDAATVLASGQYAGNGADLYISQGYNGPTPGVTAPGTYLFTFTVSSPIGMLDPGVIDKYPTFDEFCNFGDGNPVYCGGDETPQDYKLQQIDPTTYTTVVKLDAPYTITYSDGSYVNNYDKCCSWDIEATTGSAGGTYLLTVSAVLEPSAWALMVLGFGVVGAGIRAARREVLPSSK